MIAVVALARRLAGIIPSSESTTQLRFDVLTKTKQPELHRYWTSRDRAANRRLFRLAGEIVRAIGVEVFVPNPGRQCRDCQLRGRCWAWR